MKQLTRQQLQNDLDAARKREEILRKENDRFREQHTITSEVLRQLTEERDDWRFAFRTICKVVEKIK